MVGSDLNSILDQIRRLQDQNRTHDHNAAESSLAFDSQVMRQAIKIYRRGAAGRRSDKGLLDSYREAVEIGLHQSWF